MITSVPRSASCACGESIDPESVQAWNEWRADHSGGHQVTESADRIGGSTSDGREEAPAPRSMTEVLASAAWTPGAVQFNDWTRLSWTDRAAIGVVGEVAILSTQEALGFDMAGGGHANWIAVVKGDHDVHVIPGCKVQSVTFGTTSHSNVEYASVP